MKGFEMARIDYDNLFIAQGFEYREYRDVEDGTLYGRQFDCLVLEVGGHPFYLPNARQIEVDDEDFGKVRFWRDTYDANEVLKLMQASPLGFDPEKWVYEPGDGLTLEERWEGYAEEEQQERMGLR